MERFREHEKEFKMKQFSIKALTQAKGGRSGDYSNSDEYGDEDYGDEVQEDYSDEEEDKEEEQESIEKDREWL